MARTRKGGGQSPVTWLETAVLLLLMGVIGSIIYLYLAAGPSVETPKKASNTAALDQARTQTQSVAPKKDVTVEKAWDRLDRQAAAIDNLRETRTSIQSRLNKMIDASRLQEERTRDLEVQLQWLAAAFLVLAILSAGGLIWLKRRVDARKGELREQVEIAQREAEQAQRKWLNQHAARLAKLESDLAAMASRTSRAATAPAVGGGTYKPAETAPPPPPPPPPDHWPEIRAAADQMRALLNEQKASPEDYANIISRFPRRWVITAHGLEDFSDDNQRNQEIVLFGHDDAMAALPAQFAALRLSGSYIDPSRADRWFHEWFDIDSSSGRPFEIVRAAEAIVEDGQPKLTRKGAITLRG